MPTTDPDRPDVVVEEQEQIHTCQECHDPIHEGDAHITWNHGWSSRTAHATCEPCASSAMEDALFYCEACNEDHINRAQVGWSNIEWHGDWSDSTFDVNYIEIHHRWTMDGVECCEDEAPRCMECGDRLEHLPDDFEWGYGGYHCHYCRDHQGSGYIHDWSYVPPLTFRDVQNGDVVTSSRAMPGVPYLGMELEMENAGHLAENMVEDLFDPDTIWLKRDGSLDEDGVELVTHPATFEWYMTRFPFESLKELAKGGADSYHCGRAGIHIHISSDAFSKSHLFKFLSFHYDNPVICQTIGQRGSADYCSWGGWMETRPNLVQYAKKDPYSRPHHRYVAVNLTEEATIELRYFRGNLNPDRVRKNLEWVDAVYRYTKQLSSKEVREGKLTFPHLLDWMQQQGNRYATVLAFITEREINLLGEATAPVNNGAEA